MYWVGAPGVSPDASNHFWIFVIPRRTSFVGIRAIYGHRRGCIALCYRTPSKRPNESSTSVLLRLGRSRAVHAFPLVGDLRVLVRGLPPGEPRRPFSIRRPEVAQCCLRSVEIPHAAPRTAACLTPPRAAACATKLPTPPPRTAKCATPPVTRRAPRLMPATCPRRRTKHRASTVRQSSPPALRG